MAQHIETLLDSTERVILSLTADDQERGIAINTIGIWYSQAQLTQLENAIVRARAFLLAQGVE